MPQAMILKVTLAHRQPVTWRQLAVAPSITYDQLHRVLQVAFGWTDTHPYTFGPADDRASIDVTRASMTEGVRAVLTRGPLLYIYDASVSWHHEIQLIEQRDVTGPLPQCLAVRGNGFSEDGRGIVSRPVTLEALNAQLRALRIERPARTAADESLGVADAPSAEMLSELLDHLPVAGLRALLPLFEASEARRELAALPTDLLQLIVTRFLIETVLHSGKAPRAWTPADWTAALVTLLEQDADHVEDQRLTLLVIGTFMQVLSDAGELALTPAQLDATLEELAQTLAPEPGAGLSEADGEAITAQIDLYLTSRAWAHRDVRITATQAGNLLFSFAVCMAEFGSPVPTEWLPDDVVEVLGAFIPATVTLNPGDERVLAPLLRGLIAALKARGQLTAQAAMALTTAISRGDAQLQRTLAQSESKGYVPPIQPGRGEARGQLSLMGDDQAVTRTSPASRPHVLTANGKHWHQSTATRVQNDAAALGTLAQQRFGAGEAAGLFVGVVTEFVAGIYAATLLTPLHWTPAAVTQQLTTQLTPLDAATRRLHVQWLCAYFAVLGEQTSLSAKRAKALQKLAQATLVTLPDPVAAQPQPGGKVVPFRPKGAGR
ncbi:plasmid pRiA4b ORF-3 family protein [Lacticaseibacillus absianus]|uniref:plasmid pRiA4b ORF-3 family protein n=1 Tax=Lacticaseibacillus absianus TaxID=2729623 RepID=UPI0015C74C36|nr:plasmid pRiA4b ORF-3 family protein [Lacticaseibacillus absianus]